MKLLHIVSLRSGQLKLLFDDGTELKTYPSVVEQFFLTENTDLTDSQMQALREAASAMSAKQRAVRIVSAVGVSEKELQKRLVQKGEQEQDAAEAVSWLKELHLLNDEQTAEQIVRSAVNRGYGRARVKNLLYEKGIPRQLWDEALSQVPDMDDAIERFLRQRLDGREIDDKLIKKTVDALLRRGHSYGDIQNALQRYRSDCEIEPDFDPEEFS